MSIEAINQDVGTKRTKRDNGSGNIYQRDNGTWQGRVYLGLDAKGKSKFKYFSGKTQGEVKRKIREWQQQGAKFNPLKTSLQEYLTNWLKTYKYGSLKPSSYDTIEGTARNHIIPYLGCLQLQNVTSDEIQKHLNFLKNEKNYSYSTIKKVHDCLHEMFEHATVKDDVMKNPMLLVKMPASNLFEKKEIRFFTEPECALIMEEATREYSTGKKVYQYAWAYILILHTGLRMGEAIGLEKTDWDKEAGILRVRRNVQSVQKRDKNGNALTGQHLVTNTTKTYSGERDIPLNKTATEAMENLCGGDNDSKWVICDSNQHQIPPQRLERTFYRLLRNVGIEQAGVHSLRHTFASMLFDKGTKVTEISKLLGHASVSITINIYIHFMKDVNHDSVSKLDDI